VDYSRTFSYELPTKIEFGMGISERVAERVEECGGSMVLLVVDPGVLDAGVADKVINALKQASMPHVLFSDIDPEPEARSIVDGVELARSEGCDAVVGVGGGSALDSAKAMAVMLKNEGHIRDYVGQNLVPNPGVPMVALPTTAGTGSEVTIWSVISEKEEKAKYGVGSPYMTATVAMCDPELTLTLPPHLTASTGIDALAHALESYVNKTTQPISEALSIRAMELIAKSLRDAAELSVKTIRQLSEDVGTPDGLARYGAEEERLHYLAKAGMATGNVPVNPRAPTVEDLVGIMHRCMGSADVRAPV
jgi:alcohol dehydrogenase class IV